MKTKKNKSFYFFMLIFYVFHLTLIHGNPFQNSILCIPEAGSVHIDIVTESSNLSHDIHCVFFLYETQSEEVNENNSCTSVEWHHSDDNDWFKNANKITKNLTFSRIVSVFDESRLHQTLVSSLQYSMQNEIPSYNILLKKSTILLI